MSIATPAPVKTDSLHPQPSGEGTEVKKRKKDVAPTTEDRRRFANVSYWAIGWLTLAHLVALTAPFTFTWEALAVTLVLHWMTGSLGICLGYHRLLTHTGMKTYSWVRYFFTTIATNQLFRLSSVVS